MGKALARAVWLALMLCAGTVHAQEATAPPAVPPAPAQSTAVLEQALRELQAKVDELMARVPITDAQIAQRNTNQFQAVFTPARDGALRQACNQAGGVFQVTTTVGSAQPGYACVARFGTPRHWYRLWLQ